MTLLGYNKKYGEVFMHHELGEDFVKKSLNIRNFMSILDVKKYPNDPNVLNVHVHKGSMDEKSFNLEFSFGYEDLIHKSKAIVYLEPMYWIKTDDGNYEPLYEIASYNHSQPNYLHYFTKDEIDTKEKFCDHLIVCAEAILNELPF
jgi:myo-inositol-1-phosphate synthase